MKSISSRGEILAAAGFRRDFGNGVIIDDGPPKEKRRPCRGGALVIENKPVKCSHESPELQALGAKITEKFEAAKRCSLEAAEIMVELGALLEEARAKIGHGGWRQWIEDNCGISKSTVHRYIVVAGAVGRGDIDCPTVGQIGLAAALKLIAKPKPASSDPATMTDTGRQNPDKDFADLVTAWKVTGPAARTQFLSSIDKSTAVAPQARKPSADHAILLVEDIYTLINKYMAPGQEKARALLLIGGLRGAIAALENRG